MFTLVPKRWAGDTVRIRGLCHDFGKGDSRKRVLDGINLRLDRGQIVIMTGPSGSGKTTVLTLIGGLRAVQEGSLSVLGTEMASLSATELVEMRRDIGFIFQLHNLFDALTAKENVLMALELRRGLTARERNTQARAILARLGLEARINAKPQRLSGGQRQRVAIARALVNRPKLVLADEPTAALDKDSGQEVMSLFQQLTEEDGCTILIVTHDHRIIEKANCIVNMVDGRVVSNVEVEESMSMAASLQKCDLFRDKNLGVMAGIVQRASLERVAEGTVFYRPGDPAETFYIVRAGTVELRRPDRLGPEAVELRTSGDFFGEKALITGDPHTRLATAVDDVEVYALSKLDFREVLRTSPPFKEQLMNALLSGTV